MKPSIPINQCFLYRCKSKKRLAEKLGISYAELKARSEWNTYKVTQRPKRNGDGMRTIYAPTQMLKGVQRRILKLMQRIEKPNWVYSGTKGKCHIDNAFAHQGHPYVVLSDIQCFYENCTREMVYRFFNIEMRCSPDVSQILADLTTCKNAEGIRIIPSGSPCSQLLAYFAYRNMFEELEHCAAKYGCRMSLYVDDLTLSSEQPITNPTNLEKQLAKIMGGYGHRPKRSKTRYVGPSEFKLVTGVALDGTGIPQVPNRLGKNIVDGLKASLDGECEHIAPTVGRIGAARQIAPNSFPEAKRLIGQLQCT